MGWLRFAALAALMSMCWQAGAVSADDGAAALLPFKGSQAAKVRQRVQQGLDAKGAGLASFYSPSLNLGL